MKLVNRVITLLVIVIAHTNNNLIAQIGENDSLKKLLIDAKTDTVKIKLLFELGNLNKYSNPDSSILYINKSIAIANKANYLKYLGNCYKVLGVIDDEAGNYKSANNNYFNALKIYQNINDSQGMAKCHGNMAIIFRKLKSYDRAITYFHKANTQFIKTNFLPGQSVVYQNLFLIYQDLNITDSSKKYITLAFNLNKQTGSPDPFIYGNYALFFVYTNPDLAEKYFEKAINLLKEDDSKSEESVAIWQANLAFIKLNKGDITNGLLIAKKSCQAFKIKLYTKESHYAHKTLATAYQKNNDYKNAYLINELASKISDSIYTKDIALVSQELLEKYNSDKQELTIQNLKTNEKLIQIESKRKSVFLVFLIVLVFLVIVFFVFVYKSFLQKRRLSEQLKNQKQIVEIKAIELEARQKEILDSIHYAKRIQTALLPTKKYINQKIKTLR